MFPNRLLQVYADIEGGWAVTPDWLRGWATAMVQSILARSSTSNRQASVFGIL
jgi:aspartokinase-like uncharacterized kinase